MPQINIIVVETIFLPEERRNQINVDRATKLLTRMLTAVDMHLQDRDFLAGEFSGADIMTGHACIVSGRLGADISDKPNIAAYIDRLEARPALQRHGQPNKLFVLHNSGSLAKATLNRSGSTATSTPALSICNFSEDRESEFPHPLFNASVISSNAKFDRRIGTPFSRPNAVAKATSLCASLNANAGGS